MDYLPLFLRVSGRAVLVVGGGSVAARKVALLRRAGALVTVLAPALGEELAQVAAAGAVRRIEAAFAPAYIDGHALVIAATGVRAVDAAVADAARERSLWVNVVDDVSLGNALMPAIVDRSPIVIAIGTGGRSPALATRIRARIEALLDHSLGALARFAERFRGAVRARLPASADRRRFWDAVLDGDVARAIAHGHDDEAAALIEHALLRADATPRGRVILVGAGPGDPGLLTLHALRALQRADVVLYDRLVAPAILDLGRRDARCIEVGKRHGEADAVQARIMRLMLEHARAGRLVVRLKGGDPLLFARGGEELAFLRAHGIAFEVVPGVTAALACAAYAGIPLTERGVAGGVRFVTATASASGAEPDWPSLARGDDTVVFYMGASQLAVVAERLLAHGRAAQTPVAVVERGSTAAQRVLVSRLDGVGARARHSIVAPALLIVGELAARALDLAWFGAQPVDELTQPARLSDAA